MSIFDTGVDYTHPDLAANMWVNTDEVPGGGDAWYLFGQPGDTPLIGNWAAASPVPAAAANGRSDADVLAADDFASILPVATATGSKVTFSPLPEDTSATVNDRVGFGRVALLNAVMHELGHDSGDGHEEGGILADAFPPGVRPRLLDELDDMPRSDGSAATALDRVFASIGWW